MDHFIQRLSCTCKEIIVVPNVGWERKEGYLPLKTCHHQTPLPVVGDQCDQGDKSQLIADTQIHLDDYCLFYQVE